MFFRKFNLLPCLFFMVVVAIAFAFGQTKAEAQQIVYEGFDYADGSTLGRANEGTGFATTGWEVNNGTGAEFTVDASGCSIPDLEVDKSGGFIFRTASTSTTTISRRINAVLRESFTGDGTTLWGSFVYRDGNGDGLDADSSLTLASVPAAATDNHLLSVAGVGVGLSIGENGVETGGIFYDNDTVPTFGPTTLTDTEVLDATSLFLFSVQWNPDGSDDVLTFYKVTDTSAALPAAFSTTTFDFSSAEQNSLTTVNIVEAETGEFDEVRLGLSMAEVLPNSPDCLLGDVNNCGSVDFLDIGAFIAVLTSGEFQCEADCDQSGEVNFLDIAPFIAILAGQQ